MSKKKPALRTEDYFLATPVPKKLSRSIPHQLKQVDHLLVRRAWERATAELAILPSNRIIGKHETAAGMMHTYLSGLTPARLTDGDREQINAYLFPDGLTHYADELL